VGTGDDAGCGLGNGDEDGGPLPRERRAELCVFFLYFFFLSTVSFRLTRSFRTVHSWDYRRYLLASIAALPPSTIRSKPLPQPTTESELAFTTRKISANFSNFSAWHYRTKLLARQWNEKGWGKEAEERVKRVDEGALFLLSPYL
jgi:hypothetical protein